MKEQKAGLNKQWTDRSQSIFRTVKRENPYVQIDRRIYEDTRLSLKAMGLLGALLSKPNDWVISASQLISHFKEGKTAIYSAIDELLEYGYMERITHRDEKKRILYCEYLVFESPNLTAQSSPNGKISQPEQSSKKASSELLPENPEQGLRDTENPPLLKNDFRLTNDLTKKTPPLYSPQPVGRNPDTIPDLSILVPIAEKLFNQTNPEILENLWLNISEFSLDAEVVNECLSQIDAQEIKFNPYGYFRGKYTVATAIVTKKRQIVEKQRQLEELINEQDMISLSLEADSKSPQECMAEIRKILGITKKADILDSAFISP